MKYIAITERTAHWIVGHQELLDGLAAEFASFQDVPRLSQGVLTFGALRIAMARTSPIVAIWNTDYLESTGAENWGFIRVASPYGLLATDTPPSSVVFQRAVRVISLRMQKLLLPEGWIHRTTGDGLHTCVAGGDGASRQASIAYGDGDVTIDGIRRSAVLVVGPWSGESKRPTDDNRGLIDFLRAEYGVLQTMMRDADATITSTVKRPILESSLLKHLRSRFAPGLASSSPAGEVVPHVPVLSSALDGERIAAGAELSYSQWTATDSPLTGEQRAILESGILLHQPLRILGPAGSGKSLLMQLLAMRMLDSARSGGKSCRVLYIAHNSAMMNTVWNRFITLGAEDYLDSRDGELQLHVKTLFDFSRTEIGSDDIPVIDPDAQETKQFQLMIASDSLASVLNQRTSDLPSCPLLLQANADPSLRRILSYLITNEIGTAIKAHGLTENKRQYVGSERALSRLHGALNSIERDIIFDVFRRYHTQIAETEGLLDSDDLALTLLGQMRTPLWGLQRKHRGYDYVFVDETQLFNENERRLFPLMTKKDHGNLPIALALDEAQELRGSVSSRFGVLGIESIANQQLRTVYRCTEAILKLAFDLIQRTTDLFDQVNFPDFTQDAVSVVPGDHKFAKHPMITTGGTLDGGIGRFVHKHVTRLRKQLRQIGVVVHADRYWEEVVKELQASGLPVQVLCSRGERIDASRPVVAVVRPEFVGGQEFDAVLAVGLENGLVPQRVEGHAGLASTMEQQALREMYLSFTRARYQLLVVNSVMSTPSVLLKPALGSGLLIPMSGAE